MHETTSTSTAEREVIKYRWGRGWVVSVWDDTVMAWRVSRELNYYEACAMVREERASLAEAAAEAPIDGGAR